jgi:hypothetical protein
MYALCLVGGVVKILDLVNFEYVRIYYSLNEILRNSIDDMYKYKETSAFLCPC